MIPSRTSLVINSNNYKIANLQPYFYRCRNCDTNMNSNTPANLYQIQKLIQHTVRVPASEYIMNKASLNTYIQPTIITQNVCWNQQSDRPIPSVQKATIPTGYTSLNGKHTSHTSSRPGCQTPGGIGCDIKHNSYDRYLNRLKGKKDLRRGKIPPTIANPNIPFNRAFPIYGGKEFKTSIVSGCNCPQNNLDNKIIYNNSSFDEFNNIRFHFGVGMYVYAIQNKNQTNNTNYEYVKAQIIQDLGNDTFIIQFMNGIKQTVFSYEIYQYFPCNCQPSQSLTDLVTLCNYENTIENDIYNTL
jgi:hypothetical protein